MSCSLDIPSLDIAEWAAVLSALFTALAAMAAWRSARSSAVLIASSRRAHLSGGVTRGTPSGSLGLSFANAGPSMAIHVLYFVVSGNREKGAAVADGHLAPGEKWTEDLGWTAAPGEVSFLIWLWRDVESNVYLARDDWKPPQRFTRGQYLDRPETSLGAAFREMYSTVPIP